MSLVSLLGSPKQLLSAVEECLKTNGLPVNLECDHICFRVRTIEKYMHLKDSLAALSTLLTEELVNGRPIAVFSLDKPVIWRSNKIRLLELPAPKFGSLYNEGWEHVEFVTPGSLVEFVDQHPKVHFNVTNANKVINPDITLECGDGFRIKFHPQSLLRILAEEKKLKSTSESL